MKFEQIEVSMKTYLLVQLALLIITLGLLYYYKAPAWLYVATLIADAMMLVRDVKDWKQRRKGEEQ